jgi:hypothetical protein
LFDHNLMLVRTVVHVEEMKHFVFVEETCVLQFVLVNCFGEQTLVFARGIVFAKS